MFVKVLEARVGIEPTHKGFADLKAAFTQACTEFDSLMISSA
jgi:hypothetical protein